MSFDEPAASAARVLATLVGDQIVKVIYYELDYEDSEPHFLGPDCHNLDFGVELYLGTGRIVSFIWLWPISHCLGIVTGELSTEIRGGNQWDASGIDAWPTLIGHRIQAVYLECIQDEEVDGDFPLTAKIVLETTASVYITLGVGQQSDDELAVLFSDEVAKSYSRYFELSGIRR